MSTEPNLIILHGFGRSKGFKHVRINGRDAPSINLFTNPIYMQLKNIGCIAAIVPNSYSTTAKVWRPILTECWSITNRSANWILVLLSMDYSE